MKFLDSILAGYLLTAFIVVVSALIIMQQIPLLTAYKKAQASRSLFFMIINEFESIPRASKTTTIFGFSALAFLITAKCLKLRFQKSQSWDSSFLKSFQNSLVWNITITRMVIENCWPMDWQTCFQASLGLILSLGQSQGQGFKTTLEDRLSSSVQWLQLLFLYWLQLQRVYWSFYLFLL